MNLRVLKPWKDIKAGSKHTKTAWDGADDETEMMAAAAATRSIDVPIVASQIKKMAAVANRAERMSALVVIKNWRQGVGAWNNPRKMQEVIHSRTEYMANRAPNLPQDFPAFDHLVAGICARKGCGALGLGDLVALGAWVAALFFHCGSTFLCGSSRTVSEVFKTKNRQLSRRVSGVTYRHGGHAP